MGTFTLKVTKASTKETLMKTAKHLGTTLLLCLFVAACAKSTKEETARLANGTDSAKTQAEQDVAVADRTVADLKVDLTKESYSGESLKLTAKDPKNHGYIELKNADAKELYERMRVKSIDQNPRDSYTTRAKKGQNLACYEYAKTTESKDLVYACYIDIDYKTGSVMIKNEKVEADDSINVKTEAFNDGKILSVVASEGKDAGLVATLTLDSLDSKALYTSLTAEAQKGEFTGLEKKGTHVKCFEATDTENEKVLKYACAVTIDPTTGEVKAIEAAKAETADLKTAEIKYDELTLGK